MSSSIELIVNGDPYTQWVSASVIKTHTSLANEFSFTCSAVDGFPPFKLGDRVQATVAGVKALSGYIERVEGSDDDSEESDSEMVRR